MSGTLAQARGRLDADGIRFVQIEVAELDGALRGKLVPLAKALEAEIGFCTTLLTSTTADDVYEAPFASFEHGFRDFFAAPQIETIRCLPWRPRHRRGDLRHVRCRRHHDAGEPANRIA